MRRGSVVFPVGTFWRPIEDTLGTLRRLTGDRMALSGSLSHRKPLTAAHVTLICPSLSVVTGQRSLQRRSKEHDDRNDPC